MGRGFNRVMLMGNVVRDPDFKYLESKQRVCRFTLACGYKYKNRNGDVTEHTDFIGCVAWGGTAEIIQRYVRKGNPLFVEGRLSCRDFDDPKTGQHRWVTEVNAEGVVLLGGGKGAGAASSGSSCGDDEFPMDSDYEADVQECMRLQKEIYGARGMKQGAASAAQGGMSLRQESVIPENECGFGPQDFEGRSVDIPF